MSLKIIVDMNLSPGWVAEFRSAGIAAVHWSSIGDARAPDSELLNWARDNEHVVFTHDLDFGALLATARAAGPSVIQLRGQDILPDHASRLVLAALQAHGAERS